MSHESKHLNGEKRIEYEDRKSTRREKNNIKQVSFA